MLSASSASALQGKTPLKCGESFSYTLSETKKLIIEKTKRKRYNNAHRAIQLKTYTHQYTHNERGHEMSTEIIRAEDQSLAAAPQAITPDLYGRYISFLDASPKTAETYSKALRQMFKYFSLNGIKTPTRADIVAFREDLKASGHKPTTVSNYMAAVRLFFTWTEQEKLYPNIAQHIKGAKLDREHKRDYLTSGQVKNVLEIVERDTLRGARDYAILTLMTTILLIPLRLKR